MKDFVELLLIVGTSIALIFGSAHLLGSASCQNKWKDSGFRYEYRMSGGCLIQLPSDRWVPDNMVRTLQ